MYEHVYLTQSIHFQSVTGHFALLRHLKIQTSFNNFYTIQIKPLNDSLIPKKENITILF